MMPNRTIYVSDADVPVFEEAQRLAGDNLSATIAQALRRFVAARQASETGFQDVTVQVGKIAYTSKQFTGRVLAKGQISSATQPRRATYEIYQTPKGNFAVYIKEGPNWNYWNTSHADWNAWSDDRTEYRLDVYGSLAELQPQLPEELYQAVVQSLRDDPVEVLDI
jgi:EXLDI family protein